MKHIYDSFSTALCEEIMPLGDVLSSAASSSIEIEG